MLPADDRLRARMPQARTVHKGLDGLTHGMQGRWRGRRGKTGVLLRQAQQIAERSGEMVDWSEGQLQTVYEQARRDFQYAQGAEKYVPELLACICELAFRSLGLRPYAVQVMGALVLHQGAVAEMATGEGKSLTTGIGATLMACLGKPVHVLSSNDYLAQRDEEEMAPLFKRAGMTSASLGGETPPNERKEAYQGDIVYTTGKELLGDFLRDRLVLGPKVSDITRALEFLLVGQKDDGLTMRGLHSVLVDEADSVLIDEAVTPLILSAPRENISLEEATMLARDLSADLVKGEHYKVDLRDRQIVWTKAGSQCLEGLSEKLPLMWQGQERCQEIISLAVQARELFLRDEHYVVQNDEIVLLDSLTGRLTPNRNLGVGLQQAVEAKEGLEIKPPSETLARFSYQKFFRLIPHLAGMSGTVSEAAQELWKIYYLPIVKVPTHRPIIRKNLPWRIFENEEDKINALVEDACAVQQTGQSVLIGTRTVDQSEKLAEKILNQGYHCAVLNAVRHEEEAAIIAKAGQLGSLTIATNMAGRGTDIKLAPQVKDKGGLCVLSLEPQDSARIDRQLFGRSGRQGDPGSVRVYSSFDDALIKRFSSVLSRWYVRVIYRVMPRSYEKWIAQLQKKAEGHAMRQRLAILKSDDWYENYLSFPGAHRTQKKRK
ncbi:MAG: prepilin peptidase [Methylocystaceae bacterium]|nr:prepilin peptidase [Methylocystaceae bacterium]